MAARRLPLALLIFVAIPTAAPAVAEAQLPFFNARMKLPFGPVQSVDRGDLNGDGRLDLVVHATDQIGFALGTADGMADPVFVAATSSTGEVLVTDLDGDGFDDVAVAGGAPLSSEGPVLSWYRFDGTTLVFAGEFSEAFRAAAIASGDFNGDGHRDVMTCEQVTSSTKVYLGDGTALLPPRSYFTPASPVDLTVADFDGDGRDDIATIGGQTTLTPGSTGAPNTAFLIPTTELMRNFVLADFNADGRIDAAMWGTTDPFLRVALGTGDGAFTPVTETLVSPLPQLAVVEDVNGDGHLDIVGMGTRVIVIAGAGDGTFPNDFTGFNPTGVSVSHSAFGDFDEDGIRDLARANLSGGVSLLKGNGTGFLAPLASVSGFDFEHLTTGDFNCDGNLDVAASTGPLGNAPANESIRVFFGNGSGALPTSITLAGGENAAGIETADVTGDGMLDLFVAIDGESGGVNVFPGACPGGFGAPIFLPLPYVRDVVAADLDLDGTLDLVTTGGELPGIFGPNTRGELHAIRSLGGGNFEPAAFLGPGDYFGPLEAIDVTGDGVLDFAVADSYAVRVLPGNGTGGADLPVTLPHGGAGITSGDVDADGDVDLLINRGTGTTQGQNSGLLALNDGAGNFSDAQTIGTGASNRMITLDYLDLDGDLDLVVGSTNTSGSNFDRVVGARLGQNGSAFAPTTTSEIHNDPGGIAVGDFTGDGLPDVAVNLRSADRSLSVLPGDGLGNIGSPTIDAPGFHNIATTLDVNGDGRVDLVTGNLIDETVQILIGQGGGEFTVGGTFSAVGGPEAFVTGEISGDSFDDVVTLDRNGAMIVVLTGDGAGGLAPQPPISTPASPEELALRDLDGDGDLDLAILHDAALTVWNGQGNGNFTLATTIPVTSVPPGFSTNFATGTFTGGALPDLLLVGNDRVQVFPAQGGLLYGPAIDTLIPQAGAWDLDVCDANGDGALDLVLGGEGDFFQPVIGNQIHLLLGDGLGNFSLSSSFFASNPRFLTTGDFDEDGTPDLACVISNEIRVFRGLGTAFEADHEVYLVTQFYRELEAVDLNGDGSLDLLVTDSPDVLRTLPNPRSSVQPSFVRGNCNGTDATVDIGDAISVLAYLFSNEGPAVLRCADACDANDDGTLDIGDGIALLASLFSTPAAPLPQPNDGTGCGVDPTSDNLDCLIEPPGC